MGNVANTIQSYAEQRYKLNFEVFWTRMQRAIQKDKDFGPILQQAKTQLDFLVSCTSLTVVWWLVWSTSLASMKAGREHFLLVVWETLHKLTQFAEPINLHYQHPKDR
jgi:hypothetical protein